MKLRTFLIALAVAFAPTTLAVPSEGPHCGQETACGVEGGHYHALLPSVDEPRGAVLYLHGYGGSGEASLGNAGLTEPVLGRGYAFVAPTGLPIGSGRSGGRWNAFAADDWRDDVAFIQRVAEDASRRFGFPREDVLIAGFSGGGMMAWRVACDAPESFAAYAPVAGLMWRPLPETCAGPVRLHHTHGWTDTVVPIEGRSVAGGRITQGDLFEGLDLMRSAAGCPRDDPDRFDSIGPLLLRIWESCADGAELVLGLHPGGHAPPEGWTEIALDWFEASSSQRPK